MQRRLDELRDEWRRLRAEWHRRADPSHDPPCTQQDPYCTYCEGFPLFYAEIRGQIETRTTQIETEAAALVLLHEQLGAEPITNNPNGGTP